MAWIPEVSEKLHVAFRDSNVAEFKRLMREHPEHLRDEDGTDFWMWKAAMSGNLPILQALIELGMDVNESHDRSDERDPFYEPEGPILQAAGRGDLEMVRWLLANGAKINFVVNGQPRCMPLIEAAGEGHLEVVKLLVQYGADVNSTWDGLNAVTQAEKLGHPAVSEFLRSVRGS